MQVVVDGILTHYHKIGNKPKTLLILPGWMHTTDEWLPVAHQLSENFHVLLLDLPGFGKTAKPEKTFSIYDYAEFVEHFLDKLEINNIILLGHSFGGRIGIILATKTHRVSKLIMVDAAGVERRSLMAKIKIQFFKLAKVLLPKSVVAKLRLKLGSRDYKSSGEMRSIFVKVINEDLTYLLPEIKIPTLILWGNKDTEVPEWKIKLMKKLIPDAHLRVVWSAYHSPHLEKPKEFMELLTDYLYTKLYA